MLGQDKKKRVIDVDVFAFNVAPDIYQSQKNLRVDKVTIRLGTWQLGVVTLMNIIN